MTNINGPGPVIGPRLLLVKHQLLALKLNKILQEMLNPAQADQNSTQLRLIKQGHDGTGRLVVDPSGTADCSNARPIMVCRSFTS